MSARLSLRTVVSRSTRRMRCKNFCSTNHCLTQWKAASSSFTEIDMVVWSTNQCQIRFGIARMYAPSAPMIMSSNPPEANWFWPPSTCLRNSIMSFFNYSDVFATGRTWRATAHRG